MPRIMKYCDAKKALPDDSMPKERNCRFFHKRLNGPLSAKIIVSA